MVRSKHYFLIISSLLGAPALAAFNSAGLETFSGTAPDTSTWQTFNPQLISQNNGLFVNDASLGGIAQYTTNFAPVGIGGSAEVSVTITSSSSLTGVAKLAYLALTSQPTQIFGGGETYAVDTEINVNPPLADFVGDYQSGYRGTGYGQDEGFTYNEPYTLSVSRLSSTSIQYGISIYGSTVFSETEAWPAYSGPLFVAVGASSVNAEFNNLQLGGNFVVPEPASVFMISVGTLGLLISRRRQKPSNATTKSTERLPCTYREVPCSAGTERGNQTIAIKTF